MDNWDSEINNTEFKTNLDAFYAQLNGLDLKILTNEQRKIIERAMAVSELADATGSALDPLLVIQTSLDALGSQFSSAGTYLKNWIDSNNDTYLNPGYLTSQLDAVLVSLTSITPAITPKSASSVVTTLRRSVARHNNIIDGIINDLGKKKMDLGSAFEIKLNETSEGITKLQTQLETTEIGIDKVVNSSNELMTNQTTAFSKAEIERNEAFKDLLDAKEHELDLKLMDMKKKIDEDKVATGKARDRAEELVGIVSEDVMVGDYSKNAANEKKQANIWRFVTISFLLASVLLSVCYIYSVDGVTSWQKIVMRVVTIAALSGVAAYAARQSGEHRRTERKAETMALQLRAIKPYLLDVDDKKLSDEVLLSIAGKLFGHSNDEANTVIDDKVDSVSSDQLIKILIAIIDKAK